MEQLRKELLVKQEPEAKLQLHVQTPPVGGDIKPGNLLQSQQIPGGLQQVGNKRTHAPCLYTAMDFSSYLFPQNKGFALVRVLRVIVRDKYLLIFLK